MRKSFLQHFTADGAATWVVAFPSYNDSHTGPRTAGFRFDGGTQSWRTPDASAVARLALASDSVVEAVAPTIAAFDAVRADLPPELRDAPIALVDAAPIDPVAARRQAEEEKRAAYRGEQERANAEWLVERERQAAETETPTGIDHGILLRWHPEDEFTVQHPARGRFACELHEANFRCSAGLWKAIYEGGEVRIATEIASVIEIGRMPATVEAARELSRMPIDFVHSYSSYRLPRLVVVSTEAEEDARRDAKTMLHLVGADTGMIEAAYQACRVLAADDTDHARRRNDVGFGKAHVDIGHRLATMRPEFRTAYDDAFALKLSRLHRKQLPNDLAGAIGRAAA